MKLMDRGPEEIDIKADQKESLLRPSRDDTAYF